ncbi:MAG: oxaloacetate decarboxylase, partial [Bacteroidales bacterium]|nr:oxaloacetate decarboxylase [Bacteroidales bacterium]
THSDIHTVDYYMGVVDKVVEYGADEICLKDMAGIGRPHSLGLLVKKIKTRHPHLKVQYHGHTGPGFSMASMIEVAKAGADYVDVAMEPLSWGMVHPDVLAVQAMFKDAGFSVPEVNMKAYMEARHMTQTFIDDFLGYFIDPRNRFMTSLLIGSGLPGGMMGSLMADLKGVHDGINRFLRENNKPELSTDDLLIKLFEEVQHIWPMLGNPPLVTPFSQYVKNIALMNVMNLVKGGERFAMIDNNSWDMILGKAGKLPGTLALEIIALAKDKGLTFYEGTPQDNYPNELDKYRQEMKDNNWDLGQDDEELFELAMHDRQYRDYKSGIAKKRFEDEIAKAKAAAEAPLTPVSTVPQNNKPKKSKLTEIQEKYPNAKPVIVSAGGRVYWEADFEQKSIPMALGAEIKEGQTVAYLQTFYGPENVIANFNGKVVAVCAAQGELINKGEALIFVE